MKIKEKSEEATLDSDCETAKEAERKTKSKPKVLRKKAGAKKGASGAAAKKDAAKKAVKSAVKKAEKKGAVKKDVKKATKKKETVKKTGKSQKQAGFAVKKTVTRKKEDDVKKALIKKATGYDAAEITEEYCVGENGEVALSKRKVIKKNVPPDVAAIKYLLECEGGFEKNVSEMTEEELLAEKERLLKQLKEAI